MIFCKKTKKTQQGCEHCQVPFNAVTNGKEGKEKAIINIGVLDRLNYMDASGKKTGFRINHCPWCGLKLEAEVKGYQEVK